MAADLITTAVSAGGGVVVGSSFMAWLFKSYIGKVDKLIVAVTRLEATVKANDSMKDDIKDHEKRITILEPKVSRAHERIDEYHASKH